jgi:hypothetical protein
LGLTSLQIIILLYIGFTAPSVSDHLQNSIQQGVSNENIRKEEAGRHASAVDPVWKDVSKLGKLQSAVVETGPLDIPGAYFANFALQRDRPDFRKRAPPSDKWSKDESLVSKFVKKNVKSCYYYSLSRIYMHQICRTPETSLVAYNPLDDIERSLCGTSVGPKAVKVITERCQDQTVRIFPQDSPPASGYGMPPVQFIRKDCSAALTKMDNCEIPCEVTMDTCSDGRSGMDCLPDVSSWMIAGTNFDFTFYYKVPGLKIDRKAYRNYKFSASKSFQSDIPISAFKTERDGGTPPPAVAYATTSKSISFLEPQSCNGVIRAEAWASSMMKKGPEFVSYGSCLHTTDVPKGTSLNNAQDRQTLMKKHLFTLIVESSIENDFIDELVWEALHAGVIPVYYGAGNIRDHVPPNSVLLGNEIGTKDGTAERVKEIANNVTLWETFHEWRKHPFPQNLTDKFAFVKVHPYCRMCKWAYAKRFGLGWNHNSQEVQEPHIPRNPCASSDGFLLKPFRESWYSSSGLGERAKKGSTREDCTTAEGELRVEADDFSVTRIVTPHDSVFDIAFPKCVSKDGEVVLQLDFPIENWDGAHFRDVHQLIKSQHSSMRSSVSIQDRKSKVTVISNFQTQIRCPSQGRIEVVVQEATEQAIPEDEIRKLRVILEDTNPVRDVITEYGTSPFALPLIKDFLDPLELFFVEP